MFDCDEPAEALGALAASDARGTAPDADGIAEAATLSRQEHWLAENQDALESSNAFVETHGLQLIRTPNAATVASIADAKEGKVSNVDIDDL